MCSFWLPNVAGLGVGGQVSRGGCCLTWWDGNGEKGMQKKKVIDEGKIKEMKNWE